jgi:hypothetical protein
VRANDDWRRVAAMRESFVLIEARIGVSSAANVARVAPRIERWAVRRDERIPSPAASFFFIGRRPLPGVLIELLEHAHHHADAHHEGCDFHGSPPQLRATLARCES